MHTKKKEIKFIIGFGLNLQWNAWGNEWET